MQAAPRKTTPPRYAATESQQPTPGSAVLGRVPASKETKAVTQKDSRTLPSAADKQARVPVVAKPWPGAAAEKNQAAPMGAKPQPGAAATDKKRAPPVLKQAQPTEAAPPGGHIAAPVAAMPAAKQTAPAATPPGSHAGGRQAAQQQPVAKDSKPAAALGPVVAPPLSQLPAHRVDVQREAHEGSNTTANKAVATHQPAATAAPQQQPWLASAVPVGA